MAAPSSSSNGKIVTQGDWTKNLVQLAKTAELKKHALTLQLHTAHILSAHATLDQKERDIQDLKEQKNKLESERQRLLKSLREVNEDRDKADMLESQYDRECAELRERIQRLSDTEYAAAKKEVDALRAELGQPPTPSLQSLVDERSQQYLHERLAAQIGEKREEGEPVAKRPRGRPKGSKNKKTEGA
ncbi:hypothetical protein OF83DRAFT_748994 [Amylostereum chailletii]|nr:hypothetical protein OF83DRAFT_748994 [Amylostereum chailletii]